jgi:hypothetical protein
MGLFFYTYPKKRKRFENNFDQVVNRVFSTSNRKHTPKLEILKKKCNSSHQIIFLLLAKYLIDKIFMSWLVLETLVLRAPRWVKGSVVGVGRWVRMNGKVYDIDLN